MTTFVDFMNEGGYGMWPTMAFGVVTLAAAGRFAWTPERKRLGFVLGMWVTTLAHVIHSTWVDLAAVLHSCSAEEMPHDMLIRITYEGLKECTRPGILGGEFLVLAALLVSIGLHRAAARVEA